MAIPTPQTMPALLKEQILNFCRKEVKFKASLHVTGMLCLTPDRNEQAEIIVKITETLTTTNAVDANHQTNFSSLLDYFERLSQTEEPPPFSVSNNSAFKRVEAKDHDINKEKSIIEDNLHVSNSSTEASVNKNSKDCGVVMDKHPEPCTSLVSPPFLTNMVLNVGKSVVTPTLVSRSTEPVSPVARYGTAGENTPGAKAPATQVPAGFSPVESLICLARQHPHLAQVMKDRLKSGQFSPQVIKLFTEAKRKLLDGSEVPKKRVRFDDNENDVSVNGIENGLNVTKEDVGVAACADNAASEKPVNQDKKHTPDLIKVLHEQKRKFQEGKPRSQVLGITRQKNLSFDQKAALAAETSDVEPDSPLKENITKSQNLSFEPEKPVQLEEGLFAKAMHEMEDKVIETEAMERALRKERKRQSLGKKLMVKRAKMAEKERLRLTMLEKAKETILQNKDIKEKPCIQPPPSIKSNELNTISTPEKKSSDQKATKKDIDEQNAHVKCDRVSQIQHENEDVITCESVSTTPMKKPETIVKEENSVSKHSLNIDHTKEDTSKKDASAKEDVVCERTSKVHPQNNKSDTLSDHTKEDTSKIHASAMEEVVCERSSEVHPQNYESDTLSNRVCDVELKGVKSSHSNNEKLPTMIPTQSDTIKKGENDKSLSHNASSKKLDDSGLTGITMIGVDLIQSQLGLDTKSLEEPPDVLDCSWSSDPGVESFIPEVENLRFLEEESRDSVISSETVAMPFNKYQGSPNGSPSLFGLSGPVFQFDESSVGFSPLKVKSADVQPNETVNELDVIETLDMKKEKLKSEGGQIKQVEERDGDVLDRYEIQKETQSSSPTNSDEACKSKSARQPAIYAKPVIEIISVTQSATNALADTKTTKRKSPKSETKVAEFQSRLPKRVAPQDVQVKSDPKDLVKKEKDLEENLPLLTSPPSRRKNSNPKRYCDIKKPKERKCKKCGVVKICKQCNGAIKHKAGDKCKTSCPKCGAARKKALDTSPKKPAGIITVETVCCKKKGYRTPSKKAKRKKQTPPRTRPPSCKRTSQREATTPQYAWPTFSSLQKATPSQRSKTQAAHGLSLPPKFELDSPKPEENPIHEITKNNASVCEQRSKKVEVPVVCESSENNSILENSKFSKASDNKPVVTSTKHKAVRQMQNRIILGSLTANGQLQNSEDSQNNVLSLDTQGKKPAVVPDNSKVDKNTLDSIEKTCESLQANTKTSTKNPAHKPLIQVSPSSGSHLLVLPPPVYQHDTNHAHPKYTHQTDYPCNIVIKKCQVARRRTLEPVSPPKLRADSPFVHFVKDQVSIRNSRPGKRKKTSVNDGPSPKAGKFQWPSELLRDSVSPVGKGRAGKVRKKDGNFKVKTQWMETYKPAESP